MQLIETNVSSEVRGLADWLWAGQETGELSWESWMFLDRKSCDDKRDAESPAWRAGESLYPAPVTIVSEPHNLKCIYPHNRPGGRANIPIEQMGKLRQSG